MWSISLFKADVGWKKEQSFFQPWITLKKKYQWIWKERNRVMRINFVANNRKQNRNQSNSKQKITKPVAHEKRVQNKSSNAFRIEGPLAVVRPNAQYVRAAG